MKSLVYIALVLSVLMVTASMDAVPDPPAVNPHSLDLKIVGLEVPDASPEQRLHGVVPCFAVFLPVRRFDFIETVQPTRPSDQIAWVSAAGDPSPPVSL
ncbi:MAG TPA: hypothetical protein VL127_12045 [Bryobacteraceae bacterium]|jgi:hypothetical protein|nr:hypothetical protein [Bryobacteraceae bacterium]